MTLRTGAVVGGSLGGILPCPLGDGHICAWRRAAVSGADEVRQGL